MLLSIIVPIYNGSAYIRRMMDSLGETAGEQLEVILIDDGSSDDTYAQCRCIRDRNKKIKLYHNTNHGVSYSRNFGIEHASGDFVMFLDADDMLMKYWYPEIVKAIVMNRDADVILLSEKLPDCVPEKKELIESVIGWKNAYGGGYLSAPWSKLFRTSFLRDHHIRFPEDIIHGEDALFNIQAILSAEKIRMVSACIYRYRINSKSATHNYDARFLDSNERYIVELRKILEEKMPEEKAMISECIRYSFVNSVWIFAGKVSKLKNHREIRRAADDLYSRQFYRRLLTEYDTAPGLSGMKRLIYRMIRAGKLRSLERMISILRRGRKTQSERWILV